MIRANNFARTMITCLMLLISFCAFAQTKTLSFNADGKLKVVLFADTQDTQNTSSKLIKNMNKVLDTEKPDFVIFLGDQLEGHSLIYKFGNKEKNVQKAIKNIITPVADRNIPFAIVFGNHDAQGGVSREFQMAEYTKYPNCYSYDDGDSLPWCGTINVPVISTEGKTVLNFFMMDSGDYWPEGGYACVTKEQIEWCSQVANKLAEENEGQIVPSMAFQHIIVPEGYDTMKEVPSGTKGAFKGKGERKGKYYIPTPESFESGEIQESLCPSNQNFGQFESWKSQGVFAAFFGHDHINSFIGTVDGIKIGMVPGSTYVSYNNSSARGCRVLEFDQNDVKAFSTKIILYKDL